MERKDMQICTSTVRMILQLKLRGDVEIIRYFEVTLNFLSFVTYGVKWSNLAHVISGNNKKISAAKNML